MNHSCLMKLSNLVKRCFRVEKNFNSTRRPKFPFYKRKRKTERGGSETERKQKLVPCGPDSRLDIRGNFQFAHWCGTVTGFSRLHV